MNYKEYMKSPEWKALKAEAMIKAENKCEFCGRTAYAPHHVKYPKVFKDDHIDNLVVACRRCHELCHGIKRGGTAVHIGDLLSEMFYSLE